jgi:hypothetical protein
VCWSVKIRNMASSAKRFFGQTVDLGESIRQ